MPYKDAEKEKEKHKRYYYRHRDRLLEDQKQFRINRRLRVLKYYSLNPEKPECECCKEDKYEFLGIDHKEGGGVKHRKSLSSPNIDRWLIKNNFPLGYRVLCHNCNVALGIYGYCPHTK